MTRKNPPTEHLKATQWKEGQSGNPAGKPKGARNHGTWLRMFAEARLKGHKDPLGVFKGELTAEQAADLKQLNKALNGDVRSYELIKNYIHGKQNDKIEVMGEGGGPVMHSSDQEIIDRYLKTMQTKATKE